MPYITGLPVDDLQIESMLGDGPFATVYSATNKSGNHCVIKVAKTEGTGDGGTGFFHSIALERITQGFCEFEPNTKELLNIQYEFLQTYLNKHLVRPIELKSIAGLDMLLLEYVDGTSLRELIIDKKATIDHVRATALALQSLARNPNFKIHGDIKPENIIITPTGTAVLLDPGYYGQLTRSDGILVRCSITTPQYYPFVNGDDLLALGLILWEVATGQNLIATRADKSRTPGGKLADKIKTAQSTGNAYPAALANASPPQQIASILNSGIAAVVAKAVRLEFDANGVPDFAPGYAHIDELVAALDGIA